MGYSVADKYIIHGAAFNGNGTTSSEAASAGANGAWNNINVFAGTAPGFGALAAGDRVFIRSKTSAGADITVTLAGNITVGNSAATLANWITWVLDGGTIWSGIDGTLTYECPSTYGVTFRDYNEVISENEDKLIVKEMNTAGNYKNLVYLSTHFSLTNVFFDASLNTNSVNSTFSPASQAVGTFNNCHWKWNRAYLGLINLGEMSNVELVNPKIEILNVFASDSAVFRLGNYGCRTTVYGGRIYGAGATTGCNVVHGNDTSAGITFIGTDIPKTMTFRLAGTSGNTSPLRLEALGLDNGLGGLIHENWGSADSRNDGYYPYLNAFLPNSVNTPWSWRIYAPNASMLMPFRLGISKLYTETSATKTVTANFLISNSYGTNVVLSKNTVWIDVDYVDDATGAKKRVTSRVYSGGNLPSSTANWSSSTYGAILLNKYQLQVVTPTNIKKDTVVTVTVSGTAKSYSGLDYIFLCPDVGLT